MSSRSLILCDKTTDWVHLVVQQDFLIVSSELGYRIEQYTIFIYWETQSLAGNTGVCTGLHFVITKNIPMNILTQGHMSLCIGAKV